MSNRECAAEVLVDHQHGPIVRMICGETSIAVYLKDGTAVVTNTEGQCGLEVSGPWHKFMSTLKDIDTSQMLSQPHYTKEEELKRTAELFVKISKEQGPYFAFAFWRDCARHDIKSIDEFLEILKDTEGSKV